MRQFPHSETMVGGENQFFQFAQGKVLQLFPDVAEPAAKLVVGLPSSRKLVAFPRYAGGESVAVLRDRLVRIVAFTGHRLFSGCFL